MKKLLRVIILIVTNLMTLPFQIIAFAVLLLTTMTEEETNRLSDWATEGFHWAGRWITSGRFDD